jgi:acyl-coenzyme A thioesterase PaaI-like protein
MPFYRFMGIRLTKVEWGRSEIRMRVGRGFTQNARFALGRIVHKGKRTVVGDCQVTDEGGKLVSKGTATYLILENRKPDLVPSP